MAFALFVGAPLPAQELPSFGIFGTTGDPPALDHGQDSGLRRSHVSRIVVDVLGERSASTGERRETVFLVVALTPEGARLNEAFTTAMAGQRIAVVVGGELVSTPAIVAPSGAEFVVSCSAHDRDRLDTLIAALDPTQ